VKGRILGALIAVCLMASGCGAVRVVKPKQRQTPHLALANGGLEDAEGAGAAEWNEASYPETAYEIVLDKDIKRSGSTSGRVRHKGGDSLSGSFDQFYDTRFFAGKTLRVSGWIKTEGAERCPLCEKPGISDRTVHDADRHGAEIRILQGNGYYTTLTPFVTGTKDWTRFEAVAKIGPKPAFLIVAAILWGQGTAWFDDIKMTVVD
jgi:hypothetical protein